MGQAQSTQIEALHAGVTWHGLKTPLRRLLLAPLINRPLTTVIRWFIPTERARRLPVRQRVVQAQVSGASFRMLAPDRCANAKDLWWGRGIPTDPADAAALELAVRLARSADWFIDVGAHTGQMTLACSAANPTLRTLAFEIVPPVFELLVANCAENDVLDRVRLQLVGVGPQETDVRMPIRWNGAALPSALSSLTTTKAGARIPFEPLDIVASGLGPATRVLLKLDVEGTEADVLDGGRQVLQEHRPQIIAEVLPSTDVHRMVSILEPLGYRWFEITPKGPTERAELAPSPRGRDWLLCVDERP